MNSWINLHALWKIIVVGLLAGAGLPAVFAIGLRALALGPKNTAVSAGTTGGTSSSGAGSDGSMIGGNPLGLVAGAICFAIVLGGIAWGIYFVVAGS